MSQTMNEYIVRETGSPGVVKQEIVGELIRCKDCKYYWKNSKYEDDMDAVAMCLASPSDDAFCSEGKWKDDESHPFADDVMMGEWKDDV